MRDLHTATTVGSIVPSLAAESSAVEAGRQRVGRERASAALDVAAVEGRLTRNSPASDKAVVGALGRNGGSESRASSCENGQGGLEEHVDCDDSFVW